MEYRVWGERHRNRGVVGDAAPKLDDAGWDGGTTPRYRWMEGLSPIWLRPPECFASAQVSVSGIVPANLQNVLRTIGRLRFPPVFCFDG